MNRLNTNVCAALHGLDVASSAVKAELDLGPSDRPRGAFRQYNGQSYVRLFASACGLFVAILRSGNRMSYWLWMEILEANVMWHMHRIYGDGKYDSPMVPLTI